MLECPSWKRRLCIFHRLLSTEDSPLPVRTSGSTNEAAYIKRLMIYLIINRFPTIIITWTKQNHLPTPRKIDNLGGVRKAFSFQLLQQLHSQVCWSKKNPSFWLYTATQHERRSGKRSWEKYRNMEGQETDQTSWGGKGKWHLDDFPHHSYVNPELICLLLTNDCFSPQGSGL